MNEGPFRMPNRAEKDAHDQQPETISPVEEPKRVVERPKVEESNKMQRSSVSHGLNQGKFEKFRKPLIIGVIVIIILVALGFGIAAFMPNSKNTTGIDTSKYQAVFFTNGQVYFGKLQSFNDKYMKMTDIYYLQSQSTTAATDSKNPQSTSSEGNPTLIKLGNEIHGPEDEMIVSKDQLLFFENLKTDGKVAQSIKKYSNPNN